MPHKRKSYSSQKAYASTPRYPKGMRRTPRKIGVKGK